MISYFDHNDYDLIFTYNSTILIDIVQKRPEMKFVVIFQYSDAYEGKNIDRNYELGFFDNWQRNFCLDYIIFSNFNLKDYFSA